MEKKKFYNVSFIKRTVAFVEADSKEEALETATRELFGAADGIFEKSGENEYSIDMSDTSEFDINDICSNCVVLTEFGEAMDVLTYKTQQNDDI